MIRLQQPGCAQQSDVAQTIRFGGEAIDNGAVDRAVGRGVRTWIYKHSSYLPGISDRLRARRKLEWDGQVGADPFGHSITHGDVNQLDVVNDLAAFLLAIHLLLVADDMPVAILPA